MPFTPYSHNAILVIITDVRYFFTEKINIEEFTAKFLEKRTVSIHDNVTLNPFSLILILQCIIAV